MPTLVGRIRGAVSRPTSLSGGRGMTWIYVGDKHANQKEQDQTIDELRITFETWKMVRHYPDLALTIVDYHLVVRSKSGKFLGAAQIAEKACGYTIINYNGHIDEKDLHEYNRKYEDVVSYEKVG